MAGDGHPINPFARFRGAGPPKERKDSFNPLPGERESLALLDAYRALAAPELKRTAWLADLGRVEKVWARAVDAAAHARFSRLDLEEVLFRIDAGDLPLLPGIAGLFVSALMFCHDAGVFSLSLEELDLRPGFMGYRLPEGKRVKVSGSLGDFTGAFLAGGVVEVSGNVGNYTGCSMTAGTIKVGGNAGLFTGDWMRGGTIEVSGEIEGLGQDLRGSVVRG